MIIVLTADEIAIMVLTGVSRGFVSQSSRGQQATGSNRSYA
jgi:hypothetical protein